MTKLITMSLVFLFTITSVFSQTDTCDCKADLDFVVEKIKKMPSYKKQIKGEKLIDFQNTYNELASQMANPISISDCYKMLNKQLIVVNDIHARILAKTSYLSEEDFNDDTKKNQFLNATAFITHPRTTLDLGKLEINLKEKPAKSFEGIYKYGEDQVIGVYKSNDTFIGVVLTSDNLLWVPGQIKFTAQENAFGKYDMHTYHNRSRKLLFIRNLTFENGRIWSYRKSVNINNFETDIKNKSNWDFKQLTTDTQYVYFGDFSSFSTKNRKAFKDFYESHKKSFDAKHIIVDLRNNGGGNKKFSDPFIKLFKKSKTKIYILTNCYTGSNAEQFTVKLKSIKGATHLGQTTFGVIAYGINHGNTYDTPSKHFEILPTDMNFHEFYDYEGHGVDPDIKLDFDNDWIKQTLEIIENKEQ